MSTKYLDLVVVEDPSDIELNHLLQAPAFSHFEEGDKAIVPCNCGDIEMSVLGSVTVDASLEEPEAKLLIKLTRAPLPLRRITAKNVREELIYPEAEDE